MCYKYPEIKKELEKMTERSFMYKQIDDEASRQKLIITGTAALFLEGLTQQGFDYSQISVICEKPCTNKYLRYHLVDDLNKVECKWSEPDKIFITPVIDWLNIMWEEDGDKYDDIIYDILVDEYLEKQNWEKVGVDRLIFQGEMLDGIKDAAENYRLY